jgi:hypothetical protein
MNHMRYNFSQLSKSFHCDADLAANITDAMANTMSMISDLAGIVALVKRMACSAGGSATDYCPALYTHYRNCSCYFFSNVTATWVNASAICAEHGGHLITIDDTGENAFITSIGASMETSADSTVPTTFWIGLYRDPSSGTWILDQNGYNATFFLWAPNEPNGGAEEPCGQLYTISGHDSRNNKWNDARCWYQLNFICEHNLQ